MSAIATLDDFLAFFWQDYSSITPAAPRIQELLSQRGERVVNDHVAFRTFDLDPIRLESLAAPFLKFGYHPTGDYHFHAKKIRARSFSHPEPGRPHVFISELLTGQCSANLQKVACSLAGQVSPERAFSAELFTHLPTWAPLPFPTYLELLDESSYAGWLAAFGIRVNHFTVSINHLTTFPSIQSLNSWLEINGFRLNDFGGKVKGAPEKWLEQSSILADEIDWEFAAGERHKIPGCYYEFARRYIDPGTGKLYFGFITQSADRIFESTDVRLSRTDGRD